MSFGSRMRTRSVTIAPMSNENEIGNDGGDELWVENENENDGANNLGETNSMARLGWEAIWALGSPAKSKALHSLSLSLCT